MSNPVNHSPIVNLALFAGLLLASFSATANAASNELFVYDRSEYTHTTVGGQHTIHYRNRIYSINPAAGTLNHVVKEWGYNGVNVNPKADWDTEPNSNPYVSTTYNTNLVTRASA